MRFMTVTILLATLSIPAYAQQPMRAEIAAVIAGQAADITTTMIARQRGFAEANPMLPRSTACIVAVKSAMTVGLVLAIRHVAPQHPRLAMMLGAVGGGLGAFAAAHNLYAMRGQR